MHLVRYPDLAAWLMIDPAQPAPNRHACFRFYLRRSRLLMRATPAQYGRKTANNHYNSH
jgi:hypothetical protein